MTARLHAVAAVIAMALIAAFWISTAVAEAFLAPDAIAAVKRAIAWSLLALVPAIAATGATGWRLARTRTGALVKRKRLRMPFIAANGLLVLVPAALYLNAKAAVGELDTAFAAVQAVELAAGLANLVLMALNARDGVRLARAARGGAVATAAVRRAHS